MAKDEKKDEAKKNEMISAVYKVNLHCRQCARQIEKPLKKLKGVHKVDADIESGEITVTGKFDSKEIHTHIEKLSKKKVEMASIKTIMVEEKETEKVVVTTTIIKVPMHCEKCESDLGRKIRKLKGVKNVVTNRDSQTVTVEATIDQDKIIDHVRKTMRKHVEVEIKEEEVKKKKDEEVKKKGDEEVKKKEGDEEVKKKEGDEEVKKKEGDEEKDKGSKGKEEKSGEKERKEELKSNEVVVPYFVHCTHAPQLFSDENPNACFVM